jgi:hypothetical protein
MRKREIGWIVVLLLVIGAYIHYFSHWGEKKEIQIFASIRQLPRRTGNLSTMPVIFTLDQTYRLTSIKVTAVDSQHTNATEHILWHLVSQNVSEPVKYFTYGQNIQGLDPYLKGVRPEPLVPGEKYVMEITAGPLKGVSKPFTTQAIQK